MEKVFIHFIQNKALSLLVGDHLMKNMLPKDGIKKEMNQSLLFSTNIRAKLLMKRLRNLKIELSRRLIMIWQWK